MATNAEMFAFLSNFGPMLGELAARVGFLELRLEQLEGRAVAPTVDPASDPTPEVPGGGKFEFMGQTIDMEAMLKGGMPADGFAGMMDRIKNYKPPNTTASAAASAAPAAPAPNGAGTSTT